MTHFVAFFFMREDVFFPRTFFGSAPDFTAKELREERGKDIGWIQISLAWWINKQFFS